MKIVSVKRRNPLVCFFAIHQWRVGVEENGKIKYYNCWAGVDCPSKESLIRDLMRKMATDEPYKAIGTEI